MINLDRVVPITKIDLLSMIGTILTLIGTTFAVAATDIVGHVDIEGSGAAGNFLANQPMKSCDFKSGVTGATVYFIPDYGFDGFKVAGAAATMGSDSVEVLADSTNLYKAVLSSGEVTVSAVTPIID